jgi:hypothetical protein
MGKNLTETMTVIWCFQLDKWKREAESVTG